MKTNKTLPLLQLETMVFSLIVLFLPTQFGKHFWPEFAFINGLRIDYLSPTFYFTDGLILALFIVRLPFWLQILFSKTSIPFWLAALFLSFSVLVSNSIPNGIYSLVKFFEYAFLFFYITQSVPRVVSWERLTSLFALGIIGESLLAIAQFVQQGSIGSLLYFLGERSFTASTPGIANASLNGELVMRAYGTFSHPNVLAGFLLIAMLLVFFVLFPVRKPALKILASLALLLGTIGVVLTLSRIAILLWIGFIVAVFLWQIAGNRLGKTKQYASIGLVGVIVIGIMFSQILLPRFLQTALTEESVTQRQQLLLSSGQMLGQSPLTGVGPGNFLPALTAMQTPLSLSLLQPVHNIFLLVAAETGIIGLGLFVWLLGNSFKRSLTGLQRDKLHAMRYLGLLMCLSVIVATGLFDHYWLTLQQGQLLFCLILGLTWN